MDSRCTLKKNSDFRRLYSRGKNAVDAHVVVYCRRNGLDHNRLGYTVSTKLGGAVTRNRVRRRLREVYRLDQDKLKKGYDIVVVARTRAIEADFKKLEAGFMKACDKLGLKL